jgi:hypothetical protein
MAILFPLDGKADVTAYLEMEQHQRMDTQKVALEATVSLLKKGNSSP